MTASPTTPRDEEAVLAALSRYRTSPHATLGSGYVVLENYDEDTGWQVISSFSTQVAAERRCQELRVKAAISAHLKSIEYAGMVVVPREPTPKMLEEGGWVRSSMSRPVSGSSVSQSLKYKAGDIWRAMITAATSADRETV